MSSAPWHGSRSTSPNTAVTPTSSRSPADRRAATSRALAALTPDDPQYQPGFEEADTSVVAAVPIYGRYDWYSPRRRRPPGVRSRFLQRFVVKKRFAEHRQVYLDASPITRGARRRAAVLRAARPRTTRIIPVPEGRDFAAALREVVEGPRSRTPRSRTLSTLSTSSARRARTTPRRRSRSFCPGCTPAAAEASRLLRHRRCRQPSAPRKALRPGGSRRMRRSSRR